MFRIVRAVVVTIAVATSWSYTARAMEPLSSEAFALHCEAYWLAPRSADAVLCQFYIQGVIEGAASTDNRVAKSVAAGYAREDTFVQRAARMRLGQKVNRFGTAYHAQYCLDSRIPIEAVVDQVVTALDRVNFRPESGLARDFVYQVLRGGYPCERVSRL